MIDLRALFSRQPAPLIGLDISTSSVKVVELGRDKTDGWTLLAAAMVPLERGWINDGAIVKFDEVADAVRRAIKKSGTKTKQVAMALPPSAVITKKIVLPGGLNEAALEEQVQVEANQYIPFPLDEVSLDFCIIGPNAASDADIDVLIAAARREKVQDVLGLAEAVGLQPVILDVESYAARLAAGRLIATRADAGKDQTFALFEVGSGTTSMQVIRNDELLYERDQPFGGGQLTNAIMRQYGFSLEEAEAKKRSSDLPDDYDATLLRPFVGNLVAEVGRALNFFYTSTTHNRVDAILLAGGSVSLPGLSEALQAQTKATTTVVNPFEGMKLAADLRADRLAREAPSYLTACGLALRRYLT